MTHSPPMPDPPDTAPDNFDIPQTLPVIVQLADVQPNPLRWLWPERIPLGKLTLLLGEPAVGKSLLALDIAARVSAGIPWPDTPDSPRQPAGVVLLSAEDALADTVRPRLEAAQADLSRITAITSVKRNILSPLPLPLRATCLLPGLPHLDAAIQNTPDCRLVLIDPLTRSFGQTAHSFHADTRAVIEPLADLAARHQVAVVAVYQASRTAKGFAIERMIAKLSPGAARSICALLPHTTLPDHRYFIPVKNTLARSTAPLQFQLNRSEQHSAPALIWSDQPPDISTDLAVNQIAAHEDLVDAQDWLRNALSRGPIPAEAILHEAQAVGFKHRTVRKAFRQIHALRARQKNGTSGTWFWALPEHQQELEFKAAASW